jgi:hypothetical protein
MLIPALPFILIAIALVVTYALFTMNSTVASEVAAEILLAMGAIWLVVMTVLMFMSRFCIEIRPIEQFLDKDEVTKTEAAVCKLKEHVRTFVASELGQPGQDDPSLITRAMDVGAPTIDCTGGPLLLEERLTRMERTLNELAEPVLKKAYDRTMTCEGFEDAYPDPDLRLKNIQAKLYTLTKKYLDPLLQNQSDLKKGIVSDCNKRRAANAAV